MTMGPENFRKKNPPIMLSQNSVSKSSDIIHSPEFETLSDYTLFRRRHPQRSNTPVRILRNWHIELVAASQVPQLCVVGVYRDTLIRTSPIVRTVGPRRVLTSNCTYILSDPSKVLDYTVANGLNELFINGFPANWKVLLSDALGGSSGIDRRSGSTEGPRSHPLAPVPYEKRGVLIHSLEPEEKKRRRKKSTTTALEGRTMSEPVRREHDRRYSQGRIDNKQRRSSEKAYKDGERATNILKAVPESTPSTISQKERDYKAARRIPCDALSSRMNGPETAFGRRSSESALNDRLSDQSVISNDCRGGGSGEQDSTKRAVSEPTQGTGSSTTENHEEAIELQNRLRTNYLGDKTSLSEGINVDVDDISERPEQRIADPDASFKDTSSLSFAGTGISASNSPSLSAYSRLSVSTKDAVCTAPPTRSFSVPDTSSETNLTNKKVENNNDNEECAFADTGIALLPQLQPGTGHNVSEDQSPKNEREGVRKDANFSLSAVNYYLSSNREEGGAKDAQEATAASQYDKNPSVAHSTASQEKTSPTPSSKISEGEDAAALNINRSNHDLEKGIDRSASDVDLTPIDKTVNNDVSERKTFKDSDHPQEATKTEEDFDREAGSLQDHYSLSGELSDSSQPCSKVPDNLSQISPGAGPDASYFASIEMPSDLLSSSITNDTSADNISERGASSRTSPYVTVDEAVKDSLILKKKNMRARRLEKHLNNGTVSNGTRREHDAADEKQEMKEQRHSEERLEELSEAAEYVLEEEPSKRRRSSSSEEDNEESEQPAFRGRLDISTQPKNSLVNEDKVSADVGDLAVINTCLLQSSGEPEHSSDPASLVPVITGEDTKEEMKRAREGSTAADRNISSEIGSEKEEGIPNNNKRETSDKGLDLVSGAVSITRIEEGENAVSECSQGVKDTAGSSDVSGSLGSVESLEVNPVVAVAAPSQEEEELPLLSNTNEGSSRIKPVENRWGSCDSTGFPEAVPGAAEALEGTENDDMVAAGEDENYKEVNEDDGKPHEMDRGGVCSGDSEEGNENESEKEPEEAEDSHMGSLLNGKRPSIILKARQSPPSTASNESTKTTHATRLKRKRSCVCMPKKKKKSVSGSQKGRT